MHVTLSQGGFIYTREHATSRELQWLEKPLTKPQKTAKHFMQASRDQGMVLSVLLISKYCPKLETPITKEKMLKRRRKKVLKGKIKFET